MASTTVDRVQVERAVRALLAYRKKKASEALGGKEALIETADVLQLMVTVKRIPPTPPKRPFRVEVVPHQDIGAQLHLASVHTHTHSPVKHPLLGDDAEVCLITKDPQRQYKDLLQAQDVKGITKVIGITKLRTKYKPFEAKRQLVNSYDLFLADERIIPLLGKLLGVKFFEKKKYVEGSHLLGLEAKQFKGGAGAAVTALIIRQPIPVSLTKTNVQSEIAAARNAIHFYIAPGSSRSAKNLETENLGSLSMPTLVGRNLGCGKTSSLVKVGTTEQSVEQVADNIQSVLSALPTAIPFGWDNIQAISLKTTDSIALPLYNSLPTQLPTNADWSLPPKKPAPKELTFDEEDEDDVPPVSVGQKRKRDQAKVAEKQAKEGVSKVTKPTAVSAPPAAAKTTTSEQASTTTGPTAIKSAAASGAVDDREAKRSRASATNKAATKGTPATKDATSDAASAANDTKAKMPTAAIGEAVKATEKVTTSKLSSKAAGKATATSTQPKTASSTSASAAKVDATEAKAGGSKTNPQTAAKKKGSLDQTIAEPAPEAPPARSAAKRSAKAAEVSADKAPAASTDKAQPATKTASGKAASTSAGVKDVGNGTAKTSTSSAKAVAKETAKVGAKAGAKVTSKAIAEEPPKAAGRSAGKAGSRAAGKATRS